MVSKKSRSRKVVSRKTTKKRPLMKKKTSRKMSKKRRVVKKRSARKKSKKRPVMKKRSSRKKSKKVIMRGGKKPLMSKSDRIEHFMTINFDQTYNLHKLLPGLITYNTEIIKDSSFKHAEILGMVTLIPDSWKDFKDIKTYKAATSSTFKIKPEDYYKKKYFIIVKKPTGKNEKYEIEYLNSDQSFRITKFEEGKTKYFDYENETFKDDMFEFNKLRDNLLIFFKYICNELLKPYDETIASSIKNSIKSRSKLEMELLYYISQLKETQSTKSHEQALNSQTEQQETGMMATATILPYVVIFDFDECLMKDSWTGLINDLGNGIGKEDLPDTNSNVDKSVEIFKKNVDTKREVKTPFVPSFGFITGTNKVGRDAEVVEFFTKLTQKAVVYIASYGYKDVIYKVLENALREASYLLQKIIIITPSNFTIPKTPNYYDDGQDMGDNKKKMLTWIKQQNPGISLINYVFYDDNQDNVNTANSLGMTGKLAYPFSQELKVGLLEVISDEGSDSFINLE